MPNDKMVVNKFVHFCITVSLIPNTKCSVVTPSNPGEEFRPNLKMALRTDAGATNASYCTLLTERSILVAFSLISNCTGDKLLSSDIVALYCVAN